MEALIFIGVPGSGKSTFFRERLFYTHVRINRDMLRTRNRERILLEACLAAKQPFAVDNTNVRRSDRADYIQAARAAGFRVVACFFQTELRAAIWRNNQREGKQKVPVPGLIGKWKQLEPPSLSEGFDEMLSIQIANDHKFTVSSWTDPAAGFIPETN